MHTILRRIAIGSVFLFSISSFFLMATLRAVERGPSTDSAPREPELVVAGGLSFEAVSDDPEVARKARLELRGLGWEGIDRMAATFDEEMEMSPPPTAVREALDEICAQRDCWASLLFWHTDLEAAKLQARAQGKPILSLRLLGRLDEELSCANSRFFRTVLYADRDLAAYLRREVVLHWQSVGPVPKVRIEVGDRVVERTMTGNSVHYVLDEEGRALDALPGLYGAQVFRERLETILRGYDPPRSGEGRVEQELTRTDRLSRGLVRLLSGPLADDELDRDIVLSNGKLVQAPAQFPAGSKMAVEVVGIRRLTPRPNVVDLNPHDPEAARFLDEVVIPALGPQRLGDNARRIFMAKLRQGAAVGDPALNDLMATLARFEETLTRDTAFNEAFYRPRIRRHISQGHTDPEALDEWVYREVFETPLDDPWMGLVPANTYAALNGNGLFPRGHED